MPPGRGSGNKNLNMNCNAKGKHTVVPRASAGMTHNVIPTLEGTREGSPYMSTTVRPADPVRITSQLRGYGLGVRGLGATDPLTPTSHIHP